MFEKFEKFYNRYVFSCFRDDYGVNPIDIMFFSCIGSSISIASFLILQEVLNVNY